MDDIQLSTDELIKQAETAFARAGRLAAELQATLDEVHNHIQERHRYLDNLDAAAQLHKNRRRDDKL